MHNNRLSRWQEQDWRESLADVEEYRADEHPPTDLPTPPSPWPVESDVEFLDALEDQGRLLARWAS